MFKRFESPVSAKESDKYCTSSQEDYFNDAEVLDAIDKLEKAYKKAPTVAEEPIDGHLPSATVEEPTTQNFECPSFSIGLSPMEDADLQMNDFNAEIKMSFDKKEIQEQTNEGHERLLRDKRLKKLPASLRSPFCRRHMSLTQKLLKEEKIVSEFAFSSDKGNISDVLYDDGFYFATKESFCFFGGKLDWDEDVEATTIDIFTFLLNLGDCLRRPGSSKRIFFSTMAYAELGNISNEGRLSNFIERCSSELIHAEIVDISDIDIVFFPIHKNNHLPVACFNFKKAMFEIVDSRKLGEQNSRKQHTNIVSCLAKGFSSLLQSRDDPRHTFVRDCRNFIFLPLPWPSTIDFLDNIVLSMRHMETYMGESDGWSCGVKKDDVKLKLQ